VGGGGGRWGRDGEREREGRKRGLQPPSRVYSCNLIKLTSHRYSSNLIKYKRKTEGGRRGGREEEEGGGGGGKGGGGEEEEGGDGSGGGGDGERGEE